MLLSQIIGSSVFGIYEGEYLGFVKSVLFTKKYKRISKIVVSNDFDDFDYECRVSNIFSLNEQIVLVKNKGNLKKIEDHSSDLPINKIVIDIYGKVLGVMADISIDERFFVKNFVIRENVEYKDLDSESVFNVGPNACFINFDKQDLKISNFRNRSKYGKKDLENIEVSIMDETQVEVVQEVIVAKPEEKNFGTSNLLGTRCVKNIVNNRGEVLIKSGQIITKSLLDALKLNNVLSKLMK